MGVWNQGGTYERHPLYMFIMRNCNGIFCISYLGQRHSNNRIVRSSP